MHSARGDDARPSRAASRNTHGKGAKIKVRHARIVEAHYKSHVTDEPISLLIDRFDFPHGSIAFCRAIISFAHAQSRRAALHAVGRVADLGRTGDHLQSHHLQGRESRLIHSPNGPRARKESADVPEIPLHDTFESQTVEKRLRNCCARNCWQQERSQRTADRPPQGNCSKV